MRRSGNSSDNRLEMEKEKEWKRIQWRIEQQRLREHEKLKRKKIEEYERNRAEMLRAENKARSSHRCRSRSEDPDSRSHRTSKSSQTRMIVEKHNSLGSNKPLFQGPKRASKVEGDELRQITVKIHRKIPESSNDADEIKRHPFNPEEVTLTRRDGEGSKPLFSREELKSVEPQSLEVEEKRTVVTTGRNRIATNVLTKRRSTSLSPRRYSSSPVHKQNSQPYRSRHEGNFKNYTDDHHRNYKSDSLYMARDRPRHHSREDSRRCRSSRGRSHSRERSYLKSDSFYFHSSRKEEEKKSKYRSDDRLYERNKREKRDSSRERRDSSRERRFSAPSYSRLIDQISYPIFYEGFVPRPMPVQPLMPPIPPPNPMGRGVYRGPVPPFLLPRFMGSQNIFRPGLPPNGRFGRGYRP